MDGKHPWLPASKGPDPMHAEWQHDDIIELLEENRQLRRKVATLEETLDHAVDVTDFRHLLLRQLEKVQRKQPSEESASSWVASSTRSACLACGPSNGEAGQPMQWATAVSELSGSSREMPNGIYSCGKIDDGYGNSCGTVGGGPLRPATAETPWIAHCRGDSGGSESGPSDGSNEDLQQTSLDRPAGSAQKHFPWVFDEMSAPRSLPDEPILIPDSTLESTTLEGSLSQERPADGDENSACDDEMVEVHPGSGVLIPKSKLARAQDALTGTLMTRQLMKALLTEDDYLNCTLSGKRRSASAGPSCAFNANKVAAITDAVQALFGSDGMLTSKIRQTVSSVLKEKRRAHMMMKEVAENDNEG